MPGDAAVTAPRDSPRARRQETELPKSPESQAGSEEEEEEAEGSRGTRRSSATPKGLRRWMHKEGFDAASQLLLDPAGCRHRC